MTPFEVMAFSLLGILVGAMSAAGLGLFWIAGRERRAIDALARTPCPVCRQPLGAKAVNAGRVRTHEVLAELQQAQDEFDEPAVEHLLSSWVIECPHCHSVMQFDVAQRAWLQVQHPHRAD